MQVAGLSDRGLERTRNEDSCLVKSDNDKALLVVADGMGGHRAGNVASDLAISAAERFWNNLDDCHSLSVEEALEMIRRLILEANQLVLQEAENSRSLRGMGTTLTAGLLCGRHLTIGHIGDSRAYLINDGQIKLLTRDHSLVEELIEAGQVSPEEAHTHPQRHVLTRALGISPDLQVDVKELEVEAGAILLFCTDGLTGLVSDEEILQKCLETSDPHLLAETLINLANSRGGHDNITVVAAYGIGGQ